MKQRMNRFIPLGYPLQSELVGLKFANLGRVSTHYKVPPAVGISVDVFRNALGEERLTYIEKFFSDLKATVGCFLLQAMPELQKILAEVMMTDEVKQELYHQLLAVFGTLEGKTFAVRSSGTTEDSSSHSFAGVYETKLGVQGFEGICEAVVECWKSFYSYPAIAARVRVNQFDAQPAMALFIQEMVNPEFAGVAFTTPNEQGVWVEYVEGLGEGLVSGTVTPQRYCEGQEWLGEERVLQVVKKVCRIAKGLRDLFGYEIDMEWACDAKDVHVLQARPITVRLDQQAKERKSYFASAKLYLDTTLPAGMELGECRDVYVNYVKKRAGAYRLAAENGIAIGAGYVLSFNGAGLWFNKVVLNELLGTSKATQVVLDINSNIRQVILQKSDVFRYLCETFALTATSMTVYTIILRDFIKGQYGFISRLSGDNGLFVELSRDGLLNINRGFAHCEHLVVEDIDKELRGENVYGSASVEVMTLFQAALAQIVKFTKSQNVELPNSQLEWVLDDEVPYFVDFSRELGNLQYLEKVGNVVIAPGVARGPLYILQQDVVLHRLSVGPAVSVDKFDEVLENEDLQALLDSVSVLPQKPIVVVQKPYAILSALFEHVAGFIFLEGSLLCHLAILLREMGLPSIICRTLDAPAGTEVILADGILTTFQTEGVL